MPCSETSACRSSSNTSPFLSASSLKRVNAVLTARRPAARCRARQARAERVAAGKLAEHELVRVPADILGAHDLVRLAVLQHAVLVDARFVRERVRADDRLVRLNRKAGDSRDHASRPDDLRRVDARRAEDILRVRTAITISSSDALPARSPRPFIVHSTWRAPCITAASELATATPRSLWQCTDHTARSRIRNALAQRRDQRAELPRHRVADRVRNVDRRRARARSRLRAAGTGNPVPTGPRPPARTRRCRCTRAPSRPP